MQLLSPRYCYNGQYRGGLPRDSGFYSVDAVGAVLLHGVVQREDEATELGDVAVGWRPCDET